MFVRDLLETKEPVYNVIYKLSTLVPGATCHVLFNCSNRPPVS